MFKILAISGSLRSLSSNTAVLEAAAALCPQEARISLFNNLGDLPHFNPDLEGFEPKPVLDFRKALQNASGLLIASPEYAHGIVGTLKNALDWIVGSGELVNKPTALINASQRAHIAHDSLREIVKTMDGRIVADIVLPLLHNKINREGILADPRLSELLLNTIRLFLV